MKTVRSRSPVLFVVLVSWSVAPIHAATQFDFTQGSGALRWNATHQVAPLKIDSDGLIIKINGGDPYIDGPTLKAVYPNPVCLRMRLKSEAGGIAQVFWFSKQYVEEQSISFEVNRGSWTDVCIPLPPLDFDTRLRFDPPGKSGTCILSWILIDEMNVTGITRIVGTSEKLEFTVKGLNDDVEIAELAPYQTLSDAMTAPVVHRGQFEPGGRFSITRFDDENEKLRDRMYSGFVVVQTHPKFGKVPVGPIRFVEEYLDVAKFKTPFPAAKSKKGLQVQMTDDALNLGVQHAALNVDLSRVIDLTRDAPNFQWDLDGETYFFNRQYVEGLAVKELSQAGCVVTLILLAYQSDNPEIDTIMLHPKRAAVLPNRLAGFNTSTSIGWRHYRACLEFLADRFSGPDPEFGRVANYIVGNEINAHWQWYNMGQAPREIVVEDYERAVRIANAAVRRSSTTSRVYVSLEHHWTLTFGGDPQKAATGRRFLEDFNRRCRMGGNFDWHLAYHPYPENLFDPKTWLDKSATAGIDSPRITFKNLEQLDLFIRRPEFRFGPQTRRIILSEQGFHSDDTPGGDIAQAAAYCYAWKKVTRLDGIDSFILHRHVDNSQEGGLNLGLWRREPKSIGSPSTPRPIYEVFKKADTPDCDAAFRFALPVVGIKGWDEVFKKR